MSTKRFSDIDLSFKPHPVTGDLVAKYDDSAIKNAIRNLVLTSHFERPFRSELGSSIEGLLFDLEGPGLLAMIQKEITLLVANYEPRVNLLDVTATQNDTLDAIDVTLTYVIKNTLSPQTLDLVLRRTR